MNPPMLTLDRPDDCKSFLRDFSQTIGLFYIIGGWATKTLWSLNCLPNGSSTTAQSTPIINKPCSACDKHRECASPANPIHGLGADSTTCVQSWLARQSLSELDELAKRLILTCW